MPSDYKTKAYDLYLEYHGSKTQKLPEDLFEKIWNILRPYVTVVIRGKDYNVSDFDLEDHLAEVQAELWRRLCERKLPVDGPALFIGAVRLITRHLLIDIHRKNTAEERSRGHYADSTETEYLPSYSGKMLARDLVCHHKDVIAKEMAKRARIAEVDFDLCRYYVELVERKEPIRLFMDAMEMTNYWDPHFLYVYVTVLHRWVYFDVCYGPESLVA